MKIIDIYNFMDSAAPYDTQMPWDNSGLMTGRFDGEVSGIMLALDCTNDVIEQARKQKCNLILVHHPLIFNPIKSVQGGTPVYNAVKNEIAVLSAHTNLDMAKGGVNDALCSVLGIMNVEPLYAEGTPIMRMGTINECSAGMFASFVSEKLNNSVKFYNCGRAVNKVAVCGGAAGEYVRYAYDAGCDTFVTGEAKHHEYLEAEAAGINLVVAGHFSTENPVIDVLKRELTRAFPEMSIYVAQQECPYKTVM